MFHVREGRGMVYSLIAAMEVFDVCVVGAGVEGSATARYLASRGKRTLLLEQVRMREATSVINSLKGGHARDQLRPSALEGCPPLREMK